MRTCPSCSEPNADAARFCQGCGQRLVSEQTLETRKLATLLFCDVTGSTAMADGMDVEAVRRIITHFFDAMSSVIAKHGGTVEKFIGDAVMAVFGVPVVHEDDALRAVRAALEMRAKLPELAATSGVQLDVRIGVNSGEVMAGDPEAGHGFVSGDPVNVAARLEQAAEPGQILIGETTFKMVASAVEADLLGPLQVKGKSVGLRAYSLIGLKSGGPTRRTIAMVGRETELVQLRASLNEVLQNNTPAWLTVIGEAGSGKSTLLDGFVGEAGESATVLRGHCLPYGEGITFWPIAEIVRAAALIDESDTSEQASAKLAQLTADGLDAQLVETRLAGMLGLSQEVVNAQEIMWAIRRWLESMASGRPVVVIVEDLHWAEPTLLDAIEYLATFTSEVPLLLVCVARPELLERRPQWVAQTRVTHLAPLPEAEVRRFLQTLLGDAELPDVLVQHIYGASRGNPMFVHEILKLMLEEGLVSRADGRWHTASGVNSFPVPSTIQALLTSRLERLPLEERTVIQQSSVVGHDFWSGVVAALAPNKTVALGTSLQSLVRKELIQPQLSTFAGQDAFRFTHILMRDAAYTALPKERRIPLHEKVAEWLEEAAGDRLFEHEPVLAYHLEQAALLRRELGEDDAAARVRAHRAGELLAGHGRRAMAAGDLTAAVVLLRRASELLAPDSPEGLDVQVELSVALMETGHLQSSQELASRAAQTATTVGDQKAANRAHLQACALRGHLDHDVWKANGRDELEDLVAAFSSLGDELGQARAQRLLAELHWDHLRISEAEALLRQALEHARSAQDPSEIGSILSFLAAAALWGPRPVKEAIAICESIRNEAGQNQLLRAKCVSTLGVLHAMTGDFEIARQIAAEGQRLRAELGQDIAVAHGTQTRGLIEMLAGDEQAAIEEFRRGLAALESMGEKAYLGTQAALLARVLCAAGLDDEALEFTDRSQAETTEDSSGTAEWGPTRARLLARKGRLAEATALAEETLELTRVGQDILSRGDSLTSAAEVFASSGDLDRARNCLAEALALYEAKGITVWEGRIRHVLAEAR